MNKMDAWEVLSDRLHFCARGLSDRDMRWLIDELRDELDHLEARVLDSDDEDDYDDGEEE